MENANSIGMGKLPSNDEFPKEEPPKHSKKALEPASLDNILLQSLPKVEGLIDQYLYLYHNFWCPSTILKNILSSDSKLNQLDHHPPAFQAQDTDILLASKPKSGTNWLKSLLFTIIHRSKYPVLTTDDKLLHPLQATIPHRIVPQLEDNIVGDRKSIYHIDITNSLPPRLYGTHLPYHALPDSVTNSGCKIVYVCRNPLDTIVSYWHFCRLDSDSEEESRLKLEKIVDYFCKGTDAYGPHWTSVLGYWEESLKRPEKVLFMRYEELKKDVVSQIKRLAEFTGVPFTSEEEENGVVQATAEFCSLGNLKELEINKSGRRDAGFVENHRFFRKGEMGDWVSTLSPSQADRVMKVMQDKFRGTGFEL